MRSQVSADHVPTDFPESDGTLAWNKTTLVLVEANAADRHGVGNTYANTGYRPPDQRQTCGGRQGTRCDGCARMLGGHAARDSQPRPARHRLDRVSAVDVALWDLKARLLDLPFVTLLGKIRLRGFLCTAAAALHRIRFNSRRSARRMGSLGHHESKNENRQGVRGRTRRVRAGERGHRREVELFVDANGAYTRKQALEESGTIRAMDVAWFEEPVSSDDLEGLRLLRDRAPACMNIAAGEYGYDLFYFRRMLDAGAVDILQADATRCGANWVYEGRGSVPGPLPVLSAHTAPSLHAHVCCASIPVRHLEYFHDHARIEQMIVRWSPESGPRGVTRNCPGPASESNSSGPTVAVYGCRKN